MANKFLSQFIEYVSATFSNQICKEQNCNLTEVRLHHEGGERDLKIGKVDRLYLISLTENLICSEPTIIADKSVFLCFSAVPFH